MPVGEVGSYSKVEQNTERSLTMELYLPTGTTAAGMGPRLSASEFGGPSLATYLFFVSRAHRMR